MKKTPNQIREEVRRQMATYRDAEIERLKAANVAMMTKLNNAARENISLKTQNEELSERVKQLEDWNRRLMEFMDMSEEDRNVAFETLREQAQLNEAMGEFYTRAAGWLGRIFI